ncbi:NADH-quinone oxidoreductase subunit G [Helicobacter himalayensis]|uniref:NADH-quinone oxidoreductase subunit G n=1 Tax=Helicobacter himalayensis TaxID=1591088 RepID=UPI003D6FFDE0
MQEQTIQKLRIHIDGKEIACAENETILQVSRREGIEIPAICYVSKCSPTLACKLCMVEVDGKRAYACSAKVKEGMQILTHTDEINNERRAILQAYDVNHPLQCGVCDKSGECELQNYTLKFNVRAQEYFIADSPKARDSWAKVAYDPNLCIMCERCVTTCKDNLGEANLKAQKADFTPLDSALWKERMPKDALSVWNRKQKGVIGFVGQTPCYDCAECASVCPVGALIVSDFKYSANAWELRKTHTTCTHCAMGCLIIAESRHHNLKGTQKIYRISNDFEFEPICGSGRFANDEQSHKKGSLKDALQAFKNAQGVIVGDTCSNEELAILHILQKHFHLKLYNKSAQDFGAFLRVLQTNGAKLANLQSLENASCALSIGVRLESSAPTLRYKINKLIKFNKGFAFASFHPIKSKILTRLHRNVLVETYTSNALLETLGQITARLKQSAEVEPNEASFFNKNLFEDTHFIKGVILVGEESYKDANAQEIAQNLSALSEEFGLEILCIPPFGNALGMLGILHLDDCEEITPQSALVGVRARSLQGVSAQYVLDSNILDSDILDSGAIVESVSKGFVKSAFDAPDFALPAHTQIEGSVINLSFNLLPLRPSLPYDGFDLSDIAYALDSQNSAFLSDYTPYLKELNAGFVNVGNLQDLPNYYRNDGSPARGIHLEKEFLHTLKISHLHFSTRTQITESTNALLCHSPSHFNEITARASKNLQNKVGVYVSKEFADAHNIESGTPLTLKDSKGTAISANAYIDYDLEGEFFVVSPLLENALEIFKGSLYVRLECELKKSNPDSKGNV